MTPALPSIASLRARPVMRPFRHRNFRLWFLGQSVSGIGTWMQMVAQSWLVLALTGDPFQMGLVAAAQYTPVLVFGLFGGLVADGWPKRRVLMATQSMFGILAAVLWALTASGAVQVWHVALVACCLGLTNAIDMPTRNSFSVEMVGRDDVPSAVAMNSALFNAARIVGPAVAGLTIGLFGVSVAFLLNAVSYVSVITGLFLMRQSELQSPPTIARPAGVRGALRSLGEGVGYVRRTPMVLLCVVLVGTVSTFGMNFTVLIPALARDVLGTDAAGYGFLMSASGLGALISALRIAGQKRSRPMLMGIGALILGSMEVLLGLSRLYPLSLLAMLIVGFGSVAMTATANATAQLQVPDQLRGRVMSIYMTIYVGSTPVGSLIVGAIASGFGTDVAVVFGGAMSAVAGAWAFVRLRRLLAEERLEREAARAAEASGGPEASGGAEAAGGAEASGGAGASGGAQAGRRGGSANARDDAILGEADEAGLEATPAA